MIRMVVTGIAATAAAMAALATPAIAQSVTLDMAGTFPSTFKLIGEGSKRLGDKIARASGGDVALKFHEPGALVPGAETVNAVSQGSIDAAFAGAGWFSGVDITFNMFSAVPFGPGIGEYMAWMYNGGGLDIAREMFHEHDVHNIPCGIIPPEASGWFRKEIKTVDDLKGLKMRFFGLGAKVMEKMGVATQQLAPGDIFQALQLGTIDATEFSLPAIDEGLGFYQVAKYYYFPGWHQQATFFDLYINKAKWDGLSDQQQAVIEYACSDTIREMISEGEAAQGKAIKDLEGKGVHIMTWPQEILDAYKAAWDEVVAEESAKNANFKKVYESYTAFRDDYAAWQKRGYLQ